MLEDKFLAAEKPSYKGLFQLRRLLYDGTFNTQLSECVGSAFQQEIDSNKSVTLITPKTSLLESFRGKKNLIAVRYSEKHSGEYYVRVTDFIDKGGFFKLTCAFPSDTNYNLYHWKSYSPDKSKTKSEQGDIVAFTFWEKKVIKLYFMNRIVKKVENAEVIPPSAVGATIFEDEKNKKAIEMVTRDSNGDLKAKLFTKEDISNLTTGNGEKKQTTETEEEQPSTSCETDCGKPIQDNMPHTQQAYQARHKQDTSYTAKESKIKAGQMQMEGERMRAKDEQQPSTSYETDCGKPIQDNMPHTQQAYQARHKQDTSYTAKESKIKAGQMQTEGERMRAKDEEQPSTSCETDCGKPIQDNMPHTQQAYQARHKQDTSYTAKESKIKAGQMQTEGERMRAKDEEQPSTSCETDCGKPIHDNMPHTQQAYQARHKQDTSYTAKVSTTVQKNLVTQAIITSIAEQISTDWKDVGRRLKLEESILDNIEDENRKTNEKSTKMLNKWKQLNAASATIQVLMDALKQAGRRDIAETLEEMTQVHASEQDEDVRTATTALEKLELSADGFSDRGKPLTTPEK
ncbi:uncharacterized protein LOC116614957 isoform X3 [Nematostella vectensis]|uniref:uncharacterized protein LOC116614957 isoform X3 n=1 Tax=Nematostella vectensis TaxID=45351 RepID=UPI002076FF88|nr:uncharacterized protein LOC116614957 isoform X3 [Nematostella vectensis]